MLEKALIREMQAEYLGMSCYSVRDHIQEFKKPADLVTIKREAKQMGARS